MPGLRRGQRNVPARPLWWPRVPIGEGGRRGRRKRRKRRRREGRRRRWNGQVGSGGKGRPVGLGEAVEEERRRREGGREWPLGLIAAWLVGR